jgi:hypothetical protein
MPYKATSVQQCASMDCSLAFKWDACPTWHMHAHTPACYPCMASFSSTRFDFSVRKSVHGKDLMRPGDRTARKGKKSCSMQVPSAVTMAVAAFESYLQPSSGTKFLLPNSFNATVQYFNAKDLVYEFAAVSRVKVTEICSPSGERLMVCTAVTSCLKSTAVF